MKVFFLVFSMTLSTKLEQFVFSDPLHCFIQTKSGYETNGDNPFYNSLKGVRPEVIRLWCEW